jgi:hypothetical protein
MIRNRVRVPDKYAKVLHAAIVVAFALPVLRYLESRGSSVAGLFYRVGIWILIVGALLSLGLYTISLLRFFFIRYWQTENLLARAFWLAFIGMHLFILFFLLLFVLALVVGIMQGGVIYE